ncbi:MAG TPA: malate dehydrogenase [Elusimicrobia bacterium]|nr:MAG: malate dehydrogenase [Elusimicrobia bacterium RIFOXYA12_FULL_49_49]OGS11096.1 MAG: malate dehydrogenase [Elusimicrobia bacterium RIFOXYB1_FULL_48_9]OGS15811.1 MAG: malate dehydrogenase [Elusimicrobia bacterium RIFOXYA2_FULL_47_53]OGS25999.1 MAG: malate dehydrogenase [Elusimicrobia bacterium RIFOXYB12_FULL_50_12]OGS31143.1 MAG: malate dehydrogenase [Elusimicrobia bacterium RIFOXYB2_FULL_46_23]HBU69502.1 malate dehydrogenase [Elusimicrobiota bacterium]
MKNVNKLLKAAEKPSKLARKLHPYYKGKIEILPKCRVKSFDDFAVWYSPGVAAVCKDIYANPELVYEFTNKWNTIAIVSDGTRVLGLGNIGPEAGLPVMEGKALLFKYLGAVDAFPICLDTKDQDKIIETVKILQPSFGGINLEDIEQPKCFPILNRLRKECRIPVWHDDQQGTALVTLAGFINALKLAKKKISSVKITLVGAGAANIRIASLLMKFGADPLKIVMTDSEGTLHRGRTELKSGYHEKWEMCRITNGQNIVGGTAEALENADAVIALSAPGPGVIKKEWIKKMAPNPIVFVCANPVPEIWPWEAKEAGAFIVATGRSDFPNQVNNSLGFPGVFRGTLDVRASTITDEMCITAALELAACIKESRLKPTQILPTMDDWDVYPRVAAAVGMKAIEQQIADIKLSRSKIYSQAKAMITRSRAITQNMMKKGFIKP